MPLQWLLDRFQACPHDDAVIWRDAVTTYGELLRQIDAAHEFLSAQQVAAGESVMLDADFSPTAVALLIASLQQQLLVVPVASHVVADRQDLARIAECSRRFHVSASGSYETEHFSHRLGHQLLTTLRDAASPGLVLFSSGSTGRPKAAVHDVDSLVAKFKKPRHKQRLVTFLLFDHIGGFNTMMYGLANQGCLITLEARDPDTVCRAIEQHRAEVLPTSPTFLTLLLMSGRLDHYDLSSLKVINYSTEVMPESTLSQLNARFPDVTFRQSYGLSEVGILRSQSRANDSVWIRVGGEDYQTRVVDGLLHIKARSSMVGYLNAPSPFDQDGWLNTQDEVEVDGQWFRFRGRQSDIINVGGEKVYPAEVESVLFEVENIADATVTKEPHPILGNIVVALVRLQHEEDLQAVASRIRKHCFSKLPDYKVPVKVLLDDGQRVTERFKKKRQD